jgi:hypothetical protein
MKTLKLSLGLAVLALSVSACKNEKQTAAEKEVESYVMYVDSLENVAGNEVEKNWEAIEADYQTRMANLDQSMADLGENGEAKARVEASRAKYETIKTKIAAQKAAALVAMSASPQQKIRNTLFGEGRVGEDMNFSWVNKTNALAVYQQFVDAVQKNKDGYSREDWDEIKLMYEALDSRKNTVEKEGLSSDDNRKIAGLKLKFAPMYTLNRMGAKSGEMQKAKQ